MHSLEFFRLQTRTEVLSLYPRFAAVGAEEVESKLDQVDREQRVFFKKVYGKKDVEQKKSSWPWQWGGWWPKTLPPVRTCLRF